MSKDHAVSRAILIWVVCAATRAMVMPRIELPPRVMSGFLALCLLGSVFMAIACVTIGEQGHRNHVC